MYQVKIDFQSQTQVNLFLMTAESGALADFLNAQVMKMKAEDVVQTFEYAEVNMDAEKVKFVED